MEIRDEDIEIDTYYAPIHLKMGHPIMVRATHKPTGMYVERNCERSIWWNERCAKDVLVAQLIAHFKEKSMEILAKGIALKTEQCVMHHTGCIWKIRATHTHTGISIIYEGDHQNQNFAEAKAREALDAEVKRLTTNKEKQMTQKKPHKHAEVIRAFADGAEIEQRSGGGDWRPVINPSFFLTSEYRVKPVRDYPKSTLENKDLLELWADASGMDIANTARLIADAAVKRYIQDEEARKKRDGQ